MARFVALWLCGFVASSCGDTQSEYSSRTCYFVFDNDAHLDPTLAAAMTPYSGVFTTVTQTMKGGARYFVFKSNQQTQSESIFNAIDTRRTLIMGMNDGVIVGYGVLSDPVTFYAYDVNGNKGIACGLNNIMKFKDDERLGGRVSAESDFDGVGGDDDEEFE